MQSVEKKKTGKGEEKKRKGKKEGGIEGEVRVKIIRR